MLTQAVQEEHGQDLVEYAAVIALVVLALTGGMSTLANGINAAMGSLGNSINNTIG
jgi:Flp pilus assembly pilin Flp